MGSFLQSLRFIWGGTNQSGRATSVVGHPGRLVKSGLLLSVLPQSGGSRLPVPSGPALLNLSDMAWSCPEVSLPLQLMSSKPIDMLRPPSRPDLLK